jgi:hypothetical protein
VAPQKAVPWSKPEDWHVNLDSPLEGLGVADRNRFVAAWCDGSVRTLLKTIDPKTLRALLTPHGGEIIDQGAIK